MNIPDKIRIEGESWAILLVEDTESALGTRLFGHFDESKRIITLDSDHRTEETFMHELVHAVDKNHGLDLNEKQILTLAQVLYAIIVDNNLDFREENSSIK